MNGEPVDHPPLWEEGIREDVREAWASQGFPLDTDIDAEFSIDRREVVQPDLGHRSFRLVDAGAEDAVLDLPADASERYPDNWNEMVREYADRDFVVGLRISRGLFLSMGVGEWASLEPLLYAVADDPEGVASRMDAAADFAMAVCARAFNEVDFDYVQFAEPIASNAGPVVGPWTFERVCGGAYRRLVEHARSHGVRRVVFQSYGHLTPLIAPALDMGMDTFWGGDTALGNVPYADLRSKYGPELGLIGGIDAGLLDLDISAVEAGLASVVPPLLASGRYIPLLDGRVREYVPFDRYAAYRNSLVGLVGGDA